MEWIMSNASTIVVLLAVVVVLALAVRSLRAGATSCEDCNGSCGSCSTACSTPQLKLTPSQEEKLRMLQAKAEKQSNHG